MMQIRIPNSEFRTKPEARNPIPQCAGLDDLGDIRTSVFGFLSSFVIRHSDFPK